MFTTIFFIKNLTVDNYINIISSFGTVLSAFLVYATLKEMKTQRDTSHRPLLILKTLNKFELSSKNGLIDPERPKKLIEKKGEIKHYLLSEGSETIIIRLNNIGVGSAKNISYQFDELDIIKMFKVASKNNENFYFENLKQYKIIEYGYKDSPGFWQLYYNKLNASYLMPLDQQAIEIYLPTVILDILQLALSNGYESEFKVNKFKVKVNYQDIQGINYSEELPLTIKLEATTRAVYDGATQKDIPESEQEVTGHFKIYIF
ncbi:hypothetical protein QNJ39_08285 [Macrococcus caseolyticus]|uniref:hypothetical protein n=1 Tax=Macrococcoides caseolyticum TaxID=69966 RepID=UPI0024BC0BDD|nr:hypothetical protein [Macrococcus caseolyticus]MDJ1091593.1 hypothetical protein [Macrococcus caseolyticus]